MWLFFLYSMLLLVMGTYKMYLLKKDCLYGRSMVVFEGNSGILANKNMPALRAGKLWKFKQSEVDEWIKSGKAAD